MSATFLPVVSNLSRGFKDRKIDEYRTPTGDWIITRLGDTEAWTVVGGMFLESYSSLAEAKSAVISKISEKSGNPL